MPQCILCKSESLNFAGSYRCGDKPTREFFTGSRVVKCNSCNLLQLNIIPSNDKLNYFYQEIYRDEERYKAVNLEKYPFDNPWFLSRGRALTQFTSDSIREYNDRKLKILSIGAGFGYNLHALSESFPGSILFACEPDQFCQPFLRKINADIFPFILDDSDRIKQVRDNGPYNIVIMSHIIEHFADPVENVKLCLSLLDKNGVMIIEVPNCQGSISSWNIAPHISFFTPNTLERVVIQAGGKILKIDTCGPIQSTMMGFGIKKVIKSAAKFILRGGGGGHLKNSTIASAVRLTHQSVLTKT
jgi:hypothetical protein